MPAAGAVCFFLHCPAMDEYRLEIDSLTQRLAQLRAEEAEASVIDEYAAELRNLRALYRAAQEVMAAGDTDAGLRRALQDLGFGEWSLDNVYSFVYDAALDADDSDRDLAAVVEGIDFVETLRASIA